MKNKILLVMGNMKNVLWEGDVAEKKLHIDLCSCLNHR